MELKISVYEKDGTIKKACVAHTIDLEFGTIRSLMKLLKVDDINDTGELLSTVYDVWDQLVDILGHCFPDMQEEDWEHVKLKELVPVVLTMLKSSFKEILSIPKDPKN